MVKTNFLMNPTKDHPLYKSFTKTVMINRIIKLAVLAIVIVCLISAYFAPVFTISTTIKSVDNNKVVYNKSVSYTMSEFLDEQEKLNDEEKYFEDVEESVAYLRNKDFSEIERIKNVEKAYDKMNDFFTASNIIDKEISDFSDEHPEAFIALAEEADAINKYVTNDEGKRIPDINYSKVLTYVKNLEKVKMEKVLKTFTEELEARNTDGVCEFLSQATLLGKDYTGTYGDDYIEALTELESKYLVKDYAIDEDFCAELYEFADVYRFIPASAMTKDLAEEIDLFSNMSSLFAANKKIADYKYIYFTYDLDTNEAVYEQHSAITSLNKAVQIMQYGVMIVIAIAVIAMIPTIIGLIAKKQKKVRSLSPLYFPLPLIGMITCLVACANAAVSTQMVTDEVDLLCDLGSIIPTTLLVAVLVFVASIVTLIMKNIYLSKCNKWFKEAQAAEQTTEQSAEQSAEQTTEQSAKEAPAEDENN